MRPERDRHRAVSSTPCRPVERFGVWRTGWVAERFKAAVLKTAVRVSVPWVRIPPHPPSSHCEPRSAPRERRNFSRIQRGLSLLPEPSRAAPSQRPVSEWQAVSFRPNLLRPDSALGDLVFSAFCEDRRTASSAANRPGGALVLRTPGGRFASRAWAIGRRRGAGQLKPAAASCRR
jgi:hypothetical protein